MSLTVTGGTNGFEAHLEDMERYGHALVGGGEDLARLGLQIEQRGLDGAFIQAGILAPAAALAAEGKIASAATAVGAEGLMLWADGELLLVSVSLYRAADAASKWAIDNLLHPMERELGRFLAPGLALSGAAVGFGMWALGEVNPELAQQIETGVSSTVQQFLFDHPDVQQALIDAAPWFVQGVSEGLVGDSGTALLTDGKWPTNNYADAVEGLILLGNKFGHMEDTGGWRVDKLGGPAPGGPASVEQLMQNQRALSESDTPDNRIQITTIAGQPPRYIVQVNCTQTWALDHTNTDPNHPKDRIFDLDTNLHLMAGENAQVMQMVKEAMRKAGITDQDPVMLTGYSQGGIVVARLASDPTFHYNVQSMVTFGSPISRMDIPDSVKVLSVEHTTDAVPMLDGRPNPDKPNWTTVQQPISSLDEMGPIYDSHEPDRYVETAGAVDQSSDPSIQSWRDASAGFLTGNGTTQQYQISR